MKSFATNFFKIESRELSMDILEKTIQIKSPQMTISYYFYFP
ncbi:hypothetical protein bthur0013_55790 [Bacillus thuringiensis IBL 200]|nr:hypothetical protein bthur0013_55790 [Bacillus thuringiensis IBL 200]